MSWEEEAFIHHCSFEQAGIFTPEYELAFVKDRDPIFFDRREDPEQVNNLFDRMRGSREVKDLTDRILAHHEETGSPSVEWLRTVRRSL